MVPGSDIAVMMRRKSAWESRTGLENPATGPADAVAGGVTSISPARHCEEIDLGRGRLLVGTVAVALLTQAEGMQDLVDDPVPPGRALPQRIDDGTGADRLERTAEPPAETDLAGPQPAPRRD